MQEREKWGGGGCSLRTDERGRSCLCSAGGKRVAFVSRCPCLMTGCESKE